MKIVTCKTCGNEFEGRATSKYCPDCKVAKKKPTESKPEKVETNTETTAETVIEEVVEVVKEVVHEEVVRMTREEIVREYIDYVIGRKKKLVISPKHCRITIEESIKGYLNASKGN